MIFSSSVSHQDCGLPHLILPTPCLRLIHWAVFTYPLLERYIPMSLLPLILLLKKNKCFILFNKYKTPDYQFRLNCFFPYFQRAAFPDTLLHEPLVYTNVYLSISKPSQVHALSGFWLAPTTDCPVFPSNRQKQHVFFKTQLQFTVHIQLGFICLKFWPTLSPFPLLTTLQPQFHGTFHHVTPAAAFYMQMLSPQ